MSSSFGPSNVRLGSPCISTFLCVGGVRKTDTKEQQAMQFTRTGEFHHPYFTGSRPRWRFRASRNFVAFAIRLSLASQLMVVSDTSLEQVLLVLSLLALRSGLRTNTTASFSATAALARAYVYLASFLCCQSLLTTSRMSTSSRRAVRRLPHKLTNHSQVRFELAWKACDPVCTCCSLKLPQQEI
jgi:hypothetical protein